MGQTQALAGREGLAELRVRLVQVEEGAAVAGHVLGNAVAHDAGVGQLRQLSGLLGELAAGGLPLAGHAIHQGRVGIGMGGLAQFMEGLLHPVAGFNHVALQHQRVAQTVFTHKEHGLVVPAEALVVDLHAYVRLHYRRAQVAFRFAQLRLALQGAQQAFAVQLHGVPQGNGIDMVSHGLRTSPRGGMGVRRIGPSGRSIPIV